MKNLLLMTLAVGLVNAANAQGWVGTSSSNTLVPYNSSLNLSPLSVGIGTSSPSEQLHTTAGVRFQGLNNDNTLTRILAQDATGKLAWRDYSTFNQGNFWSLTGNAGTIPGTNFLGTTDANRLVFKTNNTEQATILTNGYYGIGLATPGARLHVYDGAAPGVAQMNLNTYETGVIEGNRDTKLGVYNAVPGVFGSTTWTGAALALGYTSSQIGGSYPGYEIQLVPAATVPGGNFDNTVLRFNKLVRDASGLVQSALSPQNELVIYDGNVGINLGPKNGQPNQPTASLHVDCGTPTQPNPSGLRFENLPTGGGRIMVVDKQGYVFLANDEAQIANPGGTGTSDAKLEKMNQQIIELKAAVETLKNAVRLNVDNGQTFTIFPNPAKRLVNIKFMGEASAFRTSNYSIFSVANGKVVSKGQVSSGDTQILMEQIQPGDYVITLYSTDGKLIQSEKIVFIN